MAEEQEVRLRRIEQQRQQEQEEFDTSVAAFERLLDPFRALAQTIVLKMAGLERPAPKGGHDESGYVSASLLVGIDPRVATYKKLKNLVDRNPRKIRSTPPLSKTGKKHPKRLLIHAGDLIRFLRAKDAEAFAGADTNARSDDDEACFSPEADQRRLDILESGGYPARPYNTRPDLDNQD